MDDFTRNNRMSRMATIRKKRQRTPANESDSVQGVSDNSIVSHWTPMSDISNVNHNIFSASKNLPIRSSIVHNPSTPRRQLNKGKNVQSHDARTISHIDLNGSQEVNNNATPGSVYFPTIRSPITGICNTMLHRVMTFSNQSDFNQIEQARNKRMLRMAAIREKRNRPPSQTSVEYCDEGDPVWQCKHCGALMWYAERANKSVDLEDPDLKFSLCCMQGKVELPLLKDAPHLLKNLLTNKHPKSKHFCENIIAYNMMFSFTSLGGKISPILGGRGPYCYRMNGQNFHRIGSLLPVPGSPPKFSQLYIYDTEHEDSNRIQAISSKSKKVEDALVSDLRKIIDEHNPHAKAFRIARDRFKDDDSTTVKLRLISKRNTDGRTHNLPTSSEVAALIVGDIGTTVAHRDIILQTRSGPLQRIHELHPSYLALQYPLIFPYGEDGYRPDISLSHRINNSTRKRLRVTIKEFVQYRIQERPKEAQTLMLSRRLFQQFLVDSYTMIESERLNYHRTHQKNIRADLYTNLTAATHKGNTAPCSTGKRLVLPSSFTGGARYMRENFHDAMAICKYHGYPDLFITFTCNSKWPEITRFVTERGLQPEDRPDIICRVFKMKLDAMIKDFKDNILFGVVKAVIYTIEFQKRGLPHAHILLFLEEKLPDVNHIDNIISAELPDQTHDHALYKAVTDFMLHGPCGTSNPSSPCTTDGKCTKYFPKKFVDKTYIDEDGYPVYRRRENGRTIEKNGVPLDNSYVVPYNATLLLWYRVHINVEWCNRSSSIKYLFKYVNKGHDRVTAAISTSTDDMDEIQQYYNCRYISPCEAVWRIYGFDIHYRTPAVQRLSFHLENEQSVVFVDDDPIDAVINKPDIEKSMFTQWMECNKEFPQAKDFSYLEFLSKFRWLQDSKKWKLRDRGSSVGRIYHVPPGSGEKYYLRILLNHVKGPTSYEDILTIDGILYPTFKEACYAMGLLEDDREYIDGITEASFWGSAHYIRSLFVFLLLSDSMSRPEFVWQRTWKLQADDILKKQRRILRINDLQLTDDQLQNYALAEIEKLLQRNGSSLRYHITMPQPDQSLISDGVNKLIQDELQYDKAILADEHKRLISSFTYEQKCVYDKIMEAILANNGGVFFLYGYGGTGKTFIWRALSSTIRSKGDIVLTVALSGNAALLIPGGRTAHSRFKILLQVNEDSTCHICSGTELSELLCKTKLIIWDEAPMMNRYCFEALDRSLRDILQATNPKCLEQPFGGKVIVFGGDFRQILPVIAKGTRQDIVFSTINSSYLWDFCKVLKLTRNMRIQQGTSEDDKREAKEFAEWVLSKCGFVPPTARFCSWPILCCNIKSN